MKKILILFDGEHFSESAFDFVRRLNEIKPVMITGVFLPSVDYTDVMIYYLGGMAGPLYVPTLDTDENTINSNIAKFKALCGQHHIQYTVHSKINGGVLDVVKKETRYADLMVLCSESFYSNLGESTQEDYLRDTMHNAECPVLLVPENYNFPQTAIIAFDGTESSVFAIKQFTYLLPELTNVSSLIVFASDKEEEMPDHSYIEELANCHFNDLRFVKLDADAKTYFNTWLANNGNSLLVTGSFGRSSFSELIKHNFITEVINDHKLPIFVAHK